MAVGYTDEGPAAPRGAATSVLCNVRKMFAEDIDRTRRSEKIWTGAARDLGPESALNAPYKPKISFHFACAQQ